MRRRLVVVRLLATLTLAVSLLACGSSGGGGGNGGGGGEGSCPGAVDTTSVDTFFETLACTYSLKATNQGAASDTTFVEGNGYEVVIGADKTVRIAADAGEIAFDYAAGGTYEDHAHEANAFLSAGGWQLIVQWEKASKTLVLVVTQGMASWKLDEAGPGGGGGTCDPTNDPAGKACTSGPDCEVSCVCGKGPVTSGSCSNNVCQSAAEACTFICNNGFDGWTNEFCAK